MSAQRVKRKRRFGGGQQPRAHPKPAPPVHDRAVECPCCRQTFAVLIEAEPPGAYRLKDAARFIGNISLPTLRRLIARGLIRPVRALRHLTIGREELLRYIRDNQSQ